LYATSIQNTLKEKQSLKKKILLDYLYGIPKIKLIKLDFNLKVFLNTSANYETILSTYCDSPTIINMI